MKRHRWEKVEGFDPPGTGSLRRCRDCGVLCELRRAGPRGGWAIAFIFTGRCVAAGLESRVRHPSCPPEVGAVVFSGHAEDAEWERSEGEGDREAEGR